MGYIDLDSSIDQFIMFSTHEISLQIDTLKPANLFSCTGSKQK